MWQMQENKMATNMAAIEPQIAESRSPRQLQLFVGRGTFKGSPCVKTDI
jgi:hypothetical protein